MVVKSLITRSRRKIVTIKYRGRYIYWEKGGWRILGNEDIKAHLKLSEAKAWIKEHA